MIGKCELDLFASGRSDRIQLSGVNTLRSFSQWGIVWTLCISLFTGFCIQANAQSLDNLIHVLKDPGSSNQAKEDACSKLYDMGATAAPAVPALIAQLHSNDESLLDYTITTLGQIGHGASAAIKSLEWVSNNSPSNDIRQLALSSIKSIEQDGAKNASAQQPGGGTAPATVTNPNTDGEFPGESHKAQKPENRYPPVDHAAIKHHNQEKIPDSPIPPGVIPPVFTLLPQLQQGGAPSWVKPGMRLTYYAASATVAGEGKDWKFDPHGDWKSDDGRRWSPEDKASGAGQGYTQLDIVGMSHGRAYTDMTQFLMPGMNGTPIAMAHIGMPPFRGETTEFWVNPSILRNMKSRNTSWCKVEHAPYDLGGKKYNAVWIEDSTNKTSELHVYDESTGVLLHFNSMGVGRNSPIIADNEAYNTPSVTLNEGTLVQMRMVPIPWNHPLSTQWFSHAGGLTYRGKIYVQVAGSPYSLPMSTAFRLKSEGGGGNWGIFNTSAVTGMAGSLPQTGTEMCGAYQYGGVWAPPLGLAKLTNGETLDHDPITGVTTMVSGKSDGGKVVWLQMGNQAQILKFGYDISTGVLVAEENVMHMPQATMKTVLQLQNQE